MSAHPSSADAVLFDMDGVLVDSTAPHIEAWTRFLDEHGIAHPAQGIPSLFGRRAIEAVAGLLEVDVRSDTARSAVSLLERHADELLQATAPGELLMPGADALVRHLRDDGWALAVATSARRRSAERSLGPLGEAFATLVSAEEVSHGKPDPEVYLTAAARLGVAPQAAIVVEDAPAGVEAGRRAGMHVIGITSTTEADRLFGAGAHTVVEELTEVLPHLVARSLHRRRELGPTAVRDGV